MTLRHRPVVIGGIRVGDLVSLELKAVFYTTVPTLAHLDGKIFDSFSDAITEIHSAFLADKAA